VDNQALKTLRAGVFSKKRFLRWHTVLSWIFKFDIEHIPGVENPADYGSRRFQFEGMEVKCECEESEYGKFYNEIYEFLKSGKQVRSQKVRRLARSCIIKEGKNFHSSGALVPNREERDTILKEVHSNHGTARFIHYTISSNGVDWPGMFRIADRLSGSVINVAELQSQRLGLTWGGQLSNIFRAQRFSWII
jgi:hypothetical protein